MEDVAALTLALMEIDSVNPSLVPGAAGEPEIAAFIASWAADRGLEADVLEATPGRPSVVVRARGTGGGRTLLLCGHIDTVNAEGVAPPRRDGDRLHGRGGYDMKAGVAAALATAEHALSLDLSGDVLVAAVADEEHSSIGVQEVLAQVHADAAIVTEPTELAVVVAHKGFVWADVEVRGVAAHGSRPHLGVDAIVKAAPVLAGIGALDEQLKTVTHPLLERGSVHAGTIRGGIEQSSYPERCVVSVERRTLPGETAAGFEAELAAFCGDATITTTLVREPFEIGPDHELVATVVAEAAGVLGRQPHVGGASYWADAAFIAAAGIPTVMFGPAGEGAHALEEWVSVSSTEQVAQTLAAVAARICA